MGLSVGKLGLIKIRRYLKRDMSVTQIGLGYREMASVFTIGDEEEGMFGDLGRGRGGGTQC